MADTNNDKSFKLYDKWELEKQYSPSKWSKRFRSDLVIKNHITFAAAASDRVKKRIPYEVLRYGKGKNQLLDMFGLSLPKDAPILVYIHGGYWQELERSMSAYLVQPLYKKGIRVVVVGYDLAPNVTFDQIVEEMQELDTFMRDWSAKCGAKDLWYAGHSAGAYLVASILKRRSENNSLSSMCHIRGMIFISGVYDLVPIVETYVNNKLKLTSYEAQQRSFVKINVNNLTHMKFLVVVAEHESDEFRRQSREFHEMLQKQSHSAELLIMKEKDHFDIVEKLNDEQYELVQNIIRLISNNRS